MKTKDKILKEALAQFNERGAGEVSIRSIADKIGISAGNLAYHFKNTDAIIYRLYLNLVEELDRRVAEAHQHSEVGDLGMLIRQVDQSLRIMYKYKFLLLDFVQIARRVTAIRDHFRQLVEVRKMQFHVAFDHLIAGGLMKKEQISGLYDALILRMIILGNAWIADAEIHFDEQGEAMFQFYINLQLSELLPFLTEKGLEEFRLNF